MGACVALQLFTTLENSGLLGLEKQVLSNGIQVSNSVFKSALVLIPLYFIPTLEMFFWWQVIVNLVFFFLTRYYLWKFIKSDYKPQFDKRIIKSVSGFAGGMMAMAIIASLNTQIDKLMVSKFLPLVDFGYYSIAAIISQAPVILITPIAIAILPRMVRLANIGDIVQLKAVFHQFSFLISSISIVITVILFLYSKDYILLWTKNPIIADKSFITAKLLIVGSLFLCFQYMPYHLAIANGHTSTNIRLGVVFLIFSIPSMFFFINKLGINGAALPWIIINFIAFFYLGYFLINKFLENEFKNWLLFAIFTPLISNLLIGSIAYLLTFHLPRGLYVVFYSFFIVLFSFVVNIIIFNKSNPNNRINILKILAN
jgi:O-antigen/teichoic acid export membrane protein